MVYKFSPSSLGLLDDCPRCFWLQFNKNIRRPDTIFPSLPGGMDRIIKAHFDSFIGRDQLPPELKGLNGDVKLFDNLDLLQKWRNNRAGISWQDEAGNILMGAVDNILQRDSKLIVIDYKTRGSPLKEDTADYYQDQLDIYNFLFRKNGYDTEDYGYLLFYHPNKVNENGDVLFHTDLVKMETSVSNADRLFRQALDLLGKDIPQSSDSCSFCSWARNTLI